MKSIKGSLLLVGVPQPFVSCGNRKKKGVKDHSLAAKKPIAGHTLSKASNFERHTRTGVSQGPYEISVMETD